MADANRALLIFDDFLTHLRRQGFEIGVDHYLRLQELLLKAGTEFEPQQLKTILCPIFATSRAQQEQFYRAFDSYFSLFQSIPATTTPTEVREEVLLPGSREVKRAHNRTRFYLLITVLAAVLAGASLIWRHAQNQTTGNSQLPIPTQTQWRPPPLLPKLSGVQVSPTPGLIDITVQQSRYERYLSAAKYALVGFYHASLGLTVLWLGILMPVLLFLFCSQPLPSNTLKWKVFASIRPLLPWCALVTQPLLWSSVRRLDDLWLFNSSISWIPIVASLLFLLFFRRTSRATSSAGSVHSPETDEVGFVKTLVTFASSKITGMDLISLGLRDPASDTGTSVEPDSLSRATYTRFRVALFGLALLVSFVLFLNGLMIHWAAIVAPVSFFLIYEWHRYKNRQLLLQKQRGKKPPFVWPIRIQAFAPRLFDAELFYQAARLMRLRQTGETYRLDIDASVAATADARGYPTFRYKLDTKPPEYLILIERASFRDHQAQLFNELTRAIEREGIFVARYFYDLDPRVCCAEMGGGCLSLLELRSKFPGHRLLVFGNGDKMIDPITGAAAQWTTIFLGWPDRALLTPEAPAEWSLREMSLASLFIVLPASLAGLLTLVTHFESLTETDVRGWRASHTETVPSLEADPSMVITALREYMGEPTFQWLCACAVYPELQWDLTLYFGTLPVMGDLIREENLLRLIRLPWFRSGSIPDEVRWLLLRALDPGRERAIRLALIELLERDPPPGETYAAEAHQLNLVVQRWLSHRDRARRVELLASLPATARQQLTDDYTTLRFLEAEPPSPLNVYLPTRLRRPFYQNGIPVFGLKTGVRLLMVLAIIGVGVFAREVRERIMVDDTVEAKPQVLSQFGMAYVPGGTFMMGRDLGDVGERPAHQVTVKPFFIDLYEVTNQDYQKFVLTTTHHAPPTWNGGTLPDNARLKPVTGVTWDDANAYARWAGKRLPSEEEWEFAARGSDGRLYPWGNSWQPNGANANGASNGMAMVGYYKATSPFGAYDMIGNAWEWTASDMRAYSGGQLDANLTGGNLKVIRGGSFESANSYATATYRTGWPATGARTYAETGFRCAADPGENGKGGQPANVNTQATANLEDEKLQGRVAELQIRIRQLTEDAAAEQTGRGGTGLPGGGPVHRQRLSELESAKAELDNILTQFKRQNSQNEQDYSASFHNSRIHLSLACGSCHERAVDNSIKPSLPVHKACIACHTNQFVTPTSSLCGICHTTTVGANPSVKEFPPLQAFETKFDHAQHNAGEARPPAGCTTCHRITGGKVLSTERGLNAHTTCYGCHTPTAKSSAGREIASCGVCHVLPVVGAQK